MPGKVLLISLNRCESPYPVFPLGLGYIDSALRQAGYQTRWLDCEADPTAVSRAAAEFQPDFAGISLRNIDDVMIKKRETFFNGLDMVCRDLRQQSKCPIILGGSGFSIFPRELLELSGADFGIQGEGEASLLMLLKALEDKRDVSGIPGLVFRSMEKIVVNAARSRPSREPAELPQRPPDLVEFYLRKSSMLNIQTQRGCAFLCCYCTYPLIEGKACRRREADAVAEEFKELERLGVKYVFIVDSVFNSSAEHVAGICEALVSKNVKLRWGCFLRPKGLTPELMRLMAQAGLSHIEFGSDSFCDSVLQAYGKHFTFEDIYESSELAREQKIDYCHFLICGGPGETRQTLSLGFENSQKVKGAIILALVGMRVYPGTSLFERARSEGCLPNGANLLEPYYYLSPELSEEEVFQQLREFAVRSPNWVVGDAPEKYLKAAERLRSKGIVGPLWSYFALMQRWAAASAL